MHSLPVYARPFFLTLTVNNLPGIRHKKEKLLPIFPLEPFPFRLNRNADRTEFMDNAYLDAEFARP
jgi:hypothetical protein